MKNTLKINHAERTITMDRTFAKNAENTMSAEYSHLQSVRRDYPTYTVVRRQIKKNPNKECYKGLTYEYMEKYIKAHDDEKQSIMSEYLTMRGETDEADEALATSANYQEMKKWFLEKFPAVAEFHKTRAELIEKTQQKKEAKKLEAEETKKQARRKALMTKAA